ncbi:MAG: flagellar motor protein MotB [Candidatus Velthaea sp.]
MAIVDGGRGSGRRRKKEEEKLESAGMMRWLLTYADMITLLLALFIILFSISTINKVQLQRLVHDLGGGFNSKDAINNPPKSGTTGMESGTTGDRNLQEIERQIRDYVKKNRLQDKVKTRIDKRGLVITLLTDTAMYESGSAELHPDTTALLDRINGALKKNNSEIRVEGNTDNMPIATSMYPTNWELSAARATGVTRYLVEHDGLSPARISFAGYGEFRPAHPNDNEDHRHLNRRVDIVILNPASAQSQEAQP